MPETVSILLRDGALLPADVPGPELIKNAIRRQLYAEPKTRRISNVPRNCHEISVDLILEKTGVSMFGGKPAR
jgi:hypothetical protein